MTRKIAFRFILLRGGAFYAYLKAVTSSTPTINMTDAGAIKMSFSGTFAPVAFDADKKPMPINWLADEVQPIMIINGVSYPLGVYMPAKVEETRKGTSKRVKIQCFDRALRLRDSKSDDLVFWPRGTLYLGAIKQLLSADGITTVFATPSSAVFATAREDWKLGESHLNIINDLLKEINYKPIWFDENGAAVLEPVSIPTADNIKNIFDMRDPETLVLPEITRTQDNYDRANVFIVYCANPDRTGNMIATARNENPQSPLSVQRRGREIVDVQQINNIASQAELQAYADWLRNKSLLTGETLKLTTGLRPGFGVAQAVGVLDEEDDLVAIGIEHAFTMPLVLGGQMGHTVERIVYNLE